MSFVIITDATCDLTAEYLKANDVLCIPMLYSVDGSDYYLMGEGESLSMTDFYEKMRKGSVTKTAQVNTESAINFMRPLVEKGDDILYVGFSSALSGTADSVIRALANLSEQFPNRKLKGIDSLSASAGEGLMVHYAVKMRNEGKSVDEAFKYLEANKQTFCHYFTVNDLHHLHRGGRVSKLTAIVGTLLGIKPVLHVSNEGKLINIQKARGRQKALRILVDKMAEKMTEKDQSVFISHGDCLDEAKQVAEMITAQFGITDITINFIGPVVGSHSGPGTIALFFRGKDRID